MGFDNSISNQPNLPSEARSGVAAAASLDGHDRLYMYRLNRGIAEFQSGPLIEGRSELAREIAHELAVKAPGPGTWPHRFFAEVADRCVKSQRDSIVVLYHDGYADDTPPDADKRLDAAIESLASNPHVLYVAIVAANPAKVISLEHRFAPLKDHFGVFNVRQFALDEIRDATAAAPVKGG